MGKSYRVFRPDTKLGVFLEGWLRRLAADHDGPALIVAKTVDGRTLVKFTSVERLLCAQASLGPLTPWTAPCNSSKSRSNFQKLQTPLKSLIFSDQQTTWTAPQAENGARSTLKVMGDDA
jgi:hypothetical protein